MSSEANETRKTASPAAEAVAKEAPTEQQESRRGTPKRFAVGQTVCNEKNEKGKLCNGHLKEKQTAGEAAKHLRGDDVLYQCQTCGALYMGPPMGHVRDPRKQRRYVEKDLAAILRAAGGTLPAYDYPVPGWRGEQPARLPKAAKAAPTSTAAPAPEGETAEQKKARLVAEHKAKLAAKSAPSTEQADATPDSSPAADLHRPAAEAQAATGAASAAPLSPAAATASPAAGAETPSDLSTEASTELTPGAPKDERQEAVPSLTTAAPAESAAPTESAAPAEAPAPKPKPKRAAATHPGSLPPIAPHLAPPPGETPEQKRERLRLVVEEAKRKAGKL